eukprot:7388978-Prymnesium_polylepis.1
MDRRPGSLSNDDPPPRRLATPPDHTRPLRAPRAHFQRAPSRLDRGKKWRSQRHRLHHRASRKRSNACGQSDFDDRRPPHASTQYGAKPACGRNRSERRHAYAPRVRRPRQPCTSWWRSAGGRRQHDG